MKSLSIIIPVYNVEDYIGRCLESCLKQDLPDDAMEIIVVNDGTPDHSMEIVQQLQKVYPQIRIINRENGGLSAARNAGLSEARGEYVWFVDSDDHIEPNCARDLVERAKRDNLDVLCFNLKLEHPDGSTQKYLIRYDTSRSSFTGQEFISSVEMPPAAWVALYKRDFLNKNNLRFFEGILHEDHEFTPRAYCLAKRISFIDWPVYYYYQRQGGIMKSNRNAKRCRDLLIVADSLYAFATEYLTQSMPAYDSMMQRIYFAVTQSLSFYVKDAIPLSEYRRKPYFPMKASIMTGSMKLKVMLANMSLPIYLLVYKIIKK